MNMSETPSPYVVSTATSRCKSTEWAATACASTLGEMRDPTLAVCAALCEDAADAVAVLARALERPIVGERSPGLRRMIEAGVTTTVECRAACDVLADQIQVCAECARACESCADALRRLLASYADDELTQPSNAT